MKISLSHSRPWGLTLLPLITLAFFSTQAGAGIISFNISDGSAAGNPVVQGVFGINDLGTEVGNWTNSNSFGAANPTVDLIDNTGATTGVSAIIQNAGGQAFWGAGYAGTPWNYGIAHYTATANPVTVSFNNLNAEFTFGYYAIVYLNGAAANVGAAVTDGTTTYYFQTSNPASTTPILITDTNSGDGYDVGNYALFGSAISPLTSDSITFTIPTGSIVSNNAGIGGVQLVAVVPEPATMALFAGIAALGVLLIRRRKA